MSQIKIDDSEFKKFASNLAGKAPSTIHHAIKSSLQQIGKSDIEKFRKEQIPKAFKTTSAGTSRAFTYQLINNETGLSEYSRWKPSGIFETGGDVKPTNSKFLAIITDAGKTAGGRSKYGQGKLSAMVASGELQLIVPKGKFGFIVQAAQLNSKGSYKKGSMSKIVAVLRPVIHQTKRISFFENHDANASAHTKILESVGEEALKQF